MALPIRRHGRILSTAATAEYCKYNTRVKLYPDGADGYIPVQALHCSRHVFNPDGVELVNNVPKEYKLVLPSPPTPEEEKQKRAIRRAKANLYDYIRCNPDVCWFLTLTYSAEYVNREEYGQIIKLFNRWADNAVRRKGLKYVGVVERHKQSNGLHIHLLVNDVIDRVDSGTVKCKGRKKPIKTATADRYKIPHEERKIVYNIPSWLYGFSTLIRVTDDDGLVKTATYMTKYLTKDFEKIGGRYYLHSNNLAVPKYEYCNTDFKAVKAHAEFEIENTEIQYKVVNYEQTTTSCGSEV